MRQLFRFSASAALCCVLCFAAQVVQADVEVTVSPTPVSTPVGVSQLFTAGAVAVKCEAKNPVKSYQWSVDGTSITGATGATYSYSSGTTGLHTVSCQVGIKDGTDDCGSGSGSAADTVVGVAKVQYQLNGTYTNLPAGGLSDICKGASISFKAFPDPAGAAWTSGQPVWSGAATGSGDTASATFSAVGGASVTASCGTSSSGASVSVVDNPVFTTTDAKASLVKPTTYRQAQPAGSYGFTDLENMTVSITACHDGQNWHAIMTSLSGTYSERSRLTSSIRNLTEITGPGGNTTASNSCAQAGDLKALSYDAQVWYMLSAVVAHEDVHGSKAQPSLQTTATAIESQVEALSVSDTGQSKATAITQIKALAGWSSVVNNVSGSGFKAWLKNWLAAINEDHGPGGVITTSGPNRGPAYSAEDAVIEIMVKKIKDWRAAQKPPLIGCPATGD